LKSPRETSRDYLPRNCEECYNTEQTGNRISLTNIKKPLLNLVLAAVAVSGSTSSAWANLVTNGGFETGTLAGWTSNVDVGFAWWVSNDQQAPFAGHSLAVTGCVGAPCITGTAAQQSSLSQTLATSPGSTYTLTFELNTLTYGPPAEFDVLWDGTSVLDLGPDGTL
jgi:hypothetical protein